MKKQITFLDCTLRDGGYYNVWDFETNKAQELILGLNNAGVEIIEIGYKSPVQQEYYGLFKYCNEDYLGFLSKDDSSDYAFMIDVKDFLHQGKVNTSGLDEVIVPAKDSVFTWVRLASHFATVEESSDMIHYFLDKGYRVGFNLMGGSLLSDDEVKRGAEVAQENNVEVFYVADSFGSFYPDDVRSLVRLIKSSFSGNIGIHTHDNQGMALANTLAAIDEGVTFVDGTVTGMGRGAGNLMTEQFLLGITEKNELSHYKASALLPIISDYIDPMKKAFKWGYDYVYMLSGLKNIHQTYCQKLIETNRFTNEEIGLILESIPKQSRSKYNESVLNDSVSAQLVSEQLEHSGEVKHLELGLLNSESVLICARGEEALKHKGDLTKFAVRNDIQIIECNNTGFFTSDTKRFLIILNQLKLKQWMKEKHPNNAGVQLIAGTPIPNNSVSNVSYFPFKIGNFDPFNDDLDIPDYDAGFYSIALAMRAGSKKIYLAGFDGSDKSEQNQRKNAFFKMVNNVAKENGIEIFHVTPTRYNVFKEKSLYTI